MPNATGQMAADGLGGAWLTMAGGLALILGVLFLGVWLLKRFGPKAGLGMFQRGDLKLEGQLGLGPKKSVAVVRFLNKVLVLGVTDERITLLTELEEEDEAAERKDFSKTMQQAGRDRDGPGG